MSWWLRREIWTGMRQNWRSSVFESAWRCERSEWKSLSRIRLFVTPWTVWILQTRILEWIAFPFLRGSSQPSYRTQVSRIAGRFFTSWATRKTQLKGWQVTFILQRNSWTSEKKTRRWVWWKWEEKNMKCGMTEINEWQDFPSDPVVKTSLLNAGDTGSISGQGTKSLHAILC